MLLQSWNVYGKMCAYITDNTLLKNLHSKISNILAIANLVFCWRNLNVGNCQYMLAVYWLLAIANICWQLPTYQFLAIAKIVYILWQLPNSNKPLKWSFWQLPSSDIFYGSSWNYGNRQDDILWSLAMTEDFSLLDFWRN